MKVFIIRCNCAVHPERDHTFYVNKELTVPEAREWLVKKIGGYADTRFVFISPLKVEIL